MPSLLFWRLIYGSPLLRVRVATDSNVFKRYDFVELKASQRRLVADYEPLFLPPSCAIPPCLPQALV